MILPIYTYGTPVLREKAKPVPSLTDELRHLAADMFETMHKANGIGLAANQVGRLERIIIVDISDVEESEEFTVDEAGRKPLVLINPQIISSGGTSVMEEGCLSIPEVRDEVERPESVVVRFKDIDFRDVELRTTSLLARVIQHEIDHIDGILFLDHLPELRRRLHRAQLKKIQRGEIEVAYPIVPAAPKKVGT